MSPQLIHVDLMVDLMAKYDIWVHIKTPKIKTEYLRTSTRFQQYYCLRKCAFSFGKM